MSAPERFQRLPLFPPGEIPNARESDVSEVREWSDILLVSKVREPDLAVYLPSPRNATGEAVIICPGGGYAVLAYDWEGADIARYWNSRGVAAMVLKYRLPDAASQVEPHRSPLLDAQRAMRLVRHHATAWNIDRRKIGIMGFSAGGHLAATLSTHFDQGDPDAQDPVEHEGCRPDFSILVYAVISLTAPYVHLGSRSALLGEDPDPELLEFYSNERSVTSDTPPTLLVHSADDDLVSYRHSVDYYHALQEQGVPAALHLYPRGGHGYSLAVNDPYLGTWMERCLEWVRALSPRRPDPSWRREGSSRRERT